MNLNKILVVVISILIIAIGGAGYYVVTHSDKTWGNTSDVTDAADQDPSDYEEGVAVEAVQVSKPVAVTDFREKVLEMTDTKLEQSTEESDAFLMLNAFPGLVVSDFNGVASMGGHYEVTAGSIVYVRDEGQATSSTEQIISEEGFKSLLTNVAERLGVSLDDEENLETLLAKMQTDLLSSVPIPTEYPEKVVYGVDMNLAQEALKLDCSLRDGVFNACGSVCPATADTCTEQCAYTCEFPVEEFELDAVASTEIPIVEDVQ